MRSVCGDQLHIRNCQDIIQTGNSEVITTNVPDDKMIPLLRYYDYMFTDEGTLLTNWGIEGVTFTYDENGKPQYTDLIVNNPDGMPFMGATSAFLGGRNAAGPYEWTRELDDYARECMVAWNYPDRDWMYPTTTMTAEEGQRYTVIMGDIQTYVSEAVLAFII